MIIRHVDAPYDPAKAHDYYLKTRQLKGRKPGSIVTPIHKTGVAKVQSAAVQKLARQKAATAKIARLTIKVHALSNALKEAQKALQNKKAEDKKNSDGKTTVKERNQSKQYRDTHKSKIAVAAKKTARTTASKPKAVAGMNEKQLTDRISKIKRLITNANEQIKAAHAILKS